MDISRPLASLNQPKRSMPMSKQITTADGETATTQRPIQWWVRIAPAATEAGTILRLEGWAFANQGSPLTQLRAVALERNWPAIYPIPRPDVAAAFPGVAHAEASGFVIQIPDPPGAPFKIQLEARSPDDENWTCFARKRSDSPPPPKGESDDPNLTTPLNPGFALWFDEPLDWSRLSGRFRISGWCFTKGGEPISGIRARIGSREYSGSYGIFRGDVAESHLEKPGTFKSGFAITAEAPRGRALLRLEARVADGSWVEVVRKKIRGPFLNLRRTADAQLWAIGDYQNWIKRYDTLSRSDRHAILGRVHTLAWHPLISIVMPVYNPTAAHLRAAIDSVRTQLYPRWELCIADDASTAPHVRPLLRRYEKRDPRIKLHYREANGGIAAASNDALALTTGEFVALLDHDDVLAPAALYFVACEINAHPAARVIYSDEDKLDTFGRRADPHFKPDWNYSLFLTQNFLNHLGVFSGNLIRTTGFRSGFEGSQDYDLVLRCLERIEPEQIRHIPRVLYHWRMTEGSAALGFNAKPQARAAAIKAVSEHLAREKIAAEVTVSSEEGFLHVRYALPDDAPRVAIIIPTRDLVEQLRTCVESILNRTSYRNYELVVIDNDSREPEAIDFLNRLAADRRIRVLHSPGEFNFARLNNFGVAAVDAEFVALLNNDLSVIKGNWLTEMVSQGLRPGIGAVGARLLYPDDRIQHAGIILGAGGIAGEAHKGLPRHNHGYFSRAILAQELSAVTGACLLVRRETYLEVGGFDEEHLKVAFNDIDFCLRLRQRGYRVLYTPDAELYHHESASRGLDDTVKKNRRFEAETKYMRETWGKELEFDPAYNPNLSLTSADFTLAFPPRTQDPWRQE